jgi:hypothetical protein
LIKPISRKELIKLKKEEMSKHQAIALQVLLNIEKESPSFNLDFDKGIEDVRKAENDIDFTYFLVFNSFVNDIKACKYLGLYYIDTNAKSGVDYEYRVVPGNHIPGRKFNSNHSHKKADFDESINDVIVKTYAGDQELTFAWQLPSDILTWTIQKSEDGKSYKEITDPNSYQLQNIDNNVRTWRDTNLINYKEYYYRLYGVDIWAQRIFLDKFHDHPIDLTPPPSPFLSQPRHIGEKEVVISWSTIKNQYEDTQGFLVARSEFSDSNWVQIHDGIISPETTEFMDTSFSMDLPNYYRIYALDTAGNYSISNAAAVALVDSIPPQPPIISSASIDTNGIVTISIDPNIEHDLLGYKLLFANDSTHEFSVVEEMLELPEIKSFTEFSDTISLRSLTKNVYYKLIALDQNYNESLPSKAVELDRPDTIAPSRSIISNYSVKKSGIELSIVSSSSDDAVVIQIFRRVEGENDWTILNEIPNENTMYIDDKIVASTTYEYAVNAVDESGNISKISPIIQITTRRVPKIEQPIIEGEFNIQTRNITLRINTGLQGENYKIALYRIIDNTTRFLGYFSVSNETYEEKVPATKMNVSYVAQVVSEFDKSDFSRPFVLNNTLTD